MDTRALFDSRARRTLAKKRSKVERLLRTESSSPPRGVRMPDPRFFEDSRPGHAGRPGCADSGGNSGRTRRAAPWRSIRPRPWDALLRAPWRSCLDHRYLSDIGGR